MADSNVRNVYRVLPKWLLATISKGSINCCCRKAGKPNHKCENWRPISLPNVDLKILCNILAKRIKEIIPKIIGGIRMGSFVADKASIMSEGF